MAVSWSTFRALRKSITPAWLNDGESGLVGYALDLVKDAFAQRLYLGFLAGYPQNGPNGETAPPDALVRMGQDRLIYKGIFETDTEYAARLADHLTPHATRGNPFTLMRQLHAYTGATHGVSFRTVDVRGNWYSRSATGVETASIKTTNWNWDGDTSTLGDTSRWSRFWVIVYPGTLWMASAFDWGDAAGPNWGAYVGGYQTAQTLGSTATQEQVATLRAIVNDWKPEGTRCVNIVLAFDPASFDPTAPEPDGLWGKPYKYVAGVAVPTRLATARYLDGN